MIECPKCGGDTRITETRQALSKARRRRAKLRTMAAVLADMLQEQVGAKP